MTLDRLVGNSKVVAVICNQWGDTGKGKFSDYFASSWADVIARGTGGNNAGHTVCLNGNKRIFHLLPSGITEDGNGKINIMGQGMVIDLESLSKEMDDVVELGGSYDNLMISEDAHLILPYHVERDKKKNQSQKDGGIGSTGRGIGPCYADKTRRTGVKMRDLLDQKRLFDAIDKMAREYDSEISPSQVVSDLKPYIDRIQNHIRDTFSEIHRLIASGHKILLEGAQGLLLSIEHGTYPYVTSSDCSINGTANGVGISAQAVDKCFGIVKYPFMTRVGGGPFPTELGGRISEEYCGEEHTMIEELDRNCIHHENGEYDPDCDEIKQLMNSHLPFNKGVGIRLAAGEYGATTGRPRRIGWTDAVAARYAVRINGPHMILTKADAISGIDSFKIASSYSGRGNGTDFPRDANILRKVNPNFTEFDGYGPIRDCRDYEELPESLKFSIKYLEMFTEGNVVAVSVGPDREETIVR